MVPLLIPKTLPSSQDWMAGAWSGSNFYIFGNYSWRVIKGATGLEPDWSISAIGVNTIHLWLNGVAAFNDAVVAVSDGLDGFSVATANGGASWYNGTMNATRTWTCVDTDRAGLWVALASDLSGSVGSTSTDNGASWILRSGPAAGHGWQDIIWTGSKFIAGADDGYLSTSTNGISWTTPTAAIPSAGVKNIFRHPVSDRLYINTTSAKVYYSDDGGATWTLATTPFSSFDNACGLYTGGIIVIRGATPNTGYTADITTAVFDTGNNAMPFNPSTLITGFTGGETRTIGIGRFTDQYIYGVGFQVAAAPASPFLHFTY